MSLPSDHTMQTCPFAARASELTMIRAANFTSRFGDGRRSFTKRNRYAGQNQDGQRGARISAATVNLDKTKCGAPSQVLQKPKNAEAASVPRNDR